MQRSKFSLQLTLKMYSRNIKLYFVVLLTINSFYIINCELCESGRKCPNVNEVCAACVSCIDTCESYRLHISPPCLFRCPAEGVCICKEGYKKLPGTDICVPQDLCPPANCFDHETNTWKVIYK